MLYDYSPSGRDEQAFRDAYVECALWANGQHEVSGADADILHKEAYDFLGDPHAVRLIQAAMWRPIYVHASDGNGGIARVLRPSVYDWAQAGHDFYLTREGHGAGFWDRGLGMVGDALTEVSKAYGSSEYYPESEEEN